MKLSLKKDMSAEILIAETRIAALAQSKAGPSLSVYALKVEQAAAVLNGGSSRLLEAEAALKGIDVADLAKSILANAEASKSIQASLEIERQEALAAIRNAASPAQIDAIIAKYEGANG